MKFSVRDLDTVVLKAKTRMQLAGKTFFENEPVLYFDSLKTTSLEKTAATVYAQGGKGNNRLVAWEGDTALSFNMEDALLSTESLLLLSGGDYVKASATAPLFLHRTEKLKLSEDNFEKIGDSMVSITVTGKPNSSIKPCHVSILDAKSQIVSEPFPATAIRMPDNYIVTITKTDTYTPDFSFFKNNTLILIDYYERFVGNSYRVDLTPKAEEYNFYLEANTVVKDDQGFEYPAEIIIPNCKIQHNFTLNMAASGDPSTFSFVLDAFPGYTTFDPLKEVLCAVQIIDTKEEDYEYRISTNDADRNLIFDDGTPEQGGTEHTYEGGSVEG